MKKIILTILILSLIFTFCSCIANNAESNSVSVSTVSQKSDESSSSSKNIEESLESTEVPPMNYWVFGDGVDSSTKITFGDFVTAKDVDAKYIRETKNGNVYVSATANVFEIGGIVHPEKNNNEYYRLDASKKTTYSNENNALAQCTAGATIRFRTNAPSFVLKVSMRNVSAGMTHFGDRGAFGFDIYTGTGTNRIYCGNMMQFFTNANAFEDTVTLPGGWQEVQINLPLYGGVSDVQIAVGENFKLGLPTPRDYAPIAFYGSSITQGGVVSRPGNMYSNIICRALNADCLNLGFSGSAFGEQSVAEYIATREISAFVMDYDYNARSLDELENTHYNFYKTVRTAHPDIPIILVTHPYYSTENANDKARKKIIKATYNKAISDGDKNIYFVDSESFFTPQMRDLYAVDNLHPNDLGHFFMGTAIFPTLSKTLKKD